MAVRQATPIPEASMVRILLMGRLAKSIFEQLTQFADEWYVNLMVQEAVHFQYIPAFNDAVR